MRPYMQSGTVFSRTSLAYVWFVLCTRYANGFPFFLGYLNCPVSKSSQSLCLQPEVNPCIKRLCSSWQSVLLCKYRKGLAILNELVNPMLHDSYFKAFSTF